MKEDCVSVRARRFRRRAWLILILGLFIPDFQPLLSEPVLPVATGSNPRVVEGGVASYYADRHHGKQTASGEFFDMHAYTAAHRTLPFGTMLKVTYLANKRSVVVRINDRGPYVKGRVIDLSLAAAEQLQMVNRGLGQVKLEIVGRR